MDRSRNCTTLLNARMKTCIVRVPRQSACDLAPLDRTCSNVGDPMGNELSFVKATGSGCQIFRETTGRYVVSHEHQPRQQLKVATLAGAYAACRIWEQGQLAAE